LDVLVNECRILLIRSFDGEGGRKPSPRHGKDFLFHCQMPPVDEQLFLDSISLLSKQLQLCVREAQDEFRRKVREILEKHDRLAQDEYAKSGGRVQLTIDIFHVRHGQYGSMLKLVGEGFLNAFSEVVKPFCGVISPQMRLLISQVLTKQITQMINGEESAIRRNAVAMGRVDIADSAIRPMKQTFLSANSKYHELLDIEIGKHKLDVMAKVTQAEPKEGIRQPAVGTISEKVRPKHTIVKEEVDKLLKSLRLERPETTLDEAKHVHANQVGDTYANVNKSYHYKGKK
jgi:hypothetical protein